MEVVAAFLIVIVLIVVAVLGGGLYMLAMWLRHKQLDPERDKLEGPQAGEYPPRPAHLEVENEQRTRYVGHR